MRKYAEQIVSAAHRSQTSSQLTLTPAAERMPTWSLFWPLAVSTLPTLTSPISFISYADMLGEGTSVQKEAR